MRLARLRCGKTGRRRLTRPISHLLVGAALTWAACGPALADAVTTRAWDHGEFGRIVFDWQRPVDYSARVEGRSLVVEFERPMATSFEKVLANLDRYVTDATLEASGRKAVFALEGPFDRRTFVNRGSVVVDLVRPTREAQAKAPAARAAEHRLEVRIGQHYDFSRVAFDWARPVDYRIDRDGAAATISFGSPARVDLDRLSAALQPRVAGIDLVPDESGLALRLTLSEGARLRHFRTGTMIVVDVLGPGGPDAPREDLADLAPAAGQPTGPGAREPAADAGTQAPLAASELERGAELTTPPHVVAALAQKPAAQEASESRRSEDRPNARYANLAAVAKPALQAPATGEALPQDPPAAGRPTVLVPEKPAAAPPTPLLPETPTAGRPTALVPEKPVGTEPRPSKDARPIPDQGAPKAGPAKPPASSKLAGAASDRPASVALKARRTDWGLSLRFEWAEPVAAAVYRRAGAVWVVFDRPAAIDLDKLRAGAPNAVIEAERINVPEATAVRLEVKAGINPRVRREQFAWIVDLKPQELYPETPIPIAAETQALPGPRLSLAVAEAGTELEIPDPEVGDRVVVVPVGAVGHGVDGPREYAELRLLASAQGIVIEPRVDGLMVRAQPEGVEVTTAEGLHLSGRDPSLEARPRDRAARAEGALASGAAPPARRLFDFDGWRHGELGDFHEARQAFHQAVAAAEGRILNHARLDLARFYFAQGFAADALGVLQAVERDDPAMSATPDFLALRGASRYLMGNYEAAAQDLYDLRLDDEPEALLWRGLVSAAQKRWGQAANAFAQAGDLMQVYPPALKTRSALVAAEAALATGETGPAALYLDFVAENDSDEPARQRSKYLLGRLRQMEGDREAALALWDDVIRGDDRMSRVRAKFARASLLLEDGKLSEGDAAQELERLRFAWRGDEFELDVLRRLGMLYLSVGDYQNGLATLKEALTWFPDHEGSRAIALEMSEAFEALYLEGAADSLPPVKALAIYQEFRELTPAGEKGDRMASNLAERLVAVDLLSQAADLLESQVGFRLEGEERARVGARLAAIRLADKKPDLALEALSTSAAPSADLPSPADPSSAAAALPLRRVEAGEALAGGFGPPPDLQSAEADFRSAKAEGFGPQGGPQAGADLPQDLVHERRILEARALSALGRGLEALALLGGDDSGEAKLLRADILWRNENWSEAAEALKGILAPDGQDVGELDEQEIRTVLQLAVALLLDGDGRSLDGLRRRFGAAMDASRYADDFRVLTTPAPPGEVDSIQAVVARLKEVDRFEAFLKSYRARLGNRDVAAAN